MSTPLAAALAARLENPIDPAEVSFAQQGRGLRDLVLAGDWAALAGAARTAEHRARGELARCRVQLDLIRALVEALGPGGASLATRAEPWLDRHARAQVLLADAWLAWLTGTFQGSLRASAPDLRLATPRAAAVSAEADTLRADVYASAVAGRAQDIPEIAGLLAECARLAAALHGDPAHPFAGADGRKARELAIGVHGAARTAIAAACGAVALAPGLDAGTPAALVGLARRLPLIGPPTDGVDVSVKSLAAGDAERDGRLVEIVGRVVSVRQERDGDRFDAWIEVADAPARREGEPVVTVRGHFFTPLTVGMGPGWHVRLSGTYHKSWRPSGGRPCVDLDRLPQASAPAWWDRLLAAIDPVFSYRRGGMQLAWALVPHRADTLLGAGELLYLPVQRGRPELP